MVEIILLNVLFLLVLLMFVPIILEELKVKKQLVKSIMNVCYGLAIVACMTFPITVVEGVIYDLRYVATIVGGLYGGGPAIIVLYVTNLFYRLWIGGQGLYPTIIISTVLFIATYVLFPRFKKWGRKKRILYTGILSFLTAFTILISLHMYVKVNFVMYYNIFYILIHIASVLLIVYILELFHETTLLTKRIYAAEKKEIVNHLAASIAHEIRNPLTAVQGFIQLALENGVKEHNRRILELSHGEITKANNIIKNYLTFTRSAPETSILLNGKQEIEQCIAIITPFANMNSVLIETNLEEGHWITGNKALFQQCIVNIMQNCIEAMPNGGEINISLTKRNDEAYIEISDTGKGMTEEQLIRIGEPFFTTKGREGTGLGMLSAIRIIEKLGGKLRVSSKEGIGTKFQIQLKSQFKEGLVRQTSDASFF